MPTPTRHFKEELQDWLDGRLDAATCDQVERHLAWCDECRREYESVGWVKHIAAQQSGSVAAPAELRAKVLRALRAEMPAVNVVTPPLDFWTVRRRALLAAAALLMATLILAGVYFLRPAPLPAVMARDFRNYQSGQLPLQLATADVKRWKHFSPRKAWPSRRASLISA